MSDSLNLSAGRLMRPAPTLEIADSLLVAARRLQGSAVLVVTEEGRYRGVLDQAAVSRSLAAGAEPTSSLTEWLVDRPVISALMSGAEGLRQMVAAGVGEAVVVDPDQRPIGILYASAFTADAQPLVTPALVGGMATPLGVYLTTGAVSAGASKWGLVLTGMVMFAILSLGRAVEIGVRHYYPGANGPYDLLLSGLPILMFVILFRLLPLAGTHAAEHMAVNALERGEPLDPEVVARMPRTHIRCGTNLAVGAGLFFGISETPWVPWPDARLLIALIATLFLWRSLGTAVQMYVTTRRPTRAQIEDGVRAAQRLLLVHADGGRVAPSPLLRLLNSGLLQVMTGSLLMFGIVYGIGRLFGYDMDRF